MQSNNTVKKAQLNRELKDKLVSFIDKTACDLHITRHSTDFWNLSADLNIRFVLPEGSTIENTEKLQELFSIFSYEFEKTF